MALPNWFRQLAWQVQVRLDARGALTTLFDRFSEKMYAYAASLTGQASSAEDAVQDVFLQLASDHGKLKGIEDPEPYLLRAVRNRCYNQQARKSTYWEEIPEGLILGDSTMEDHCALLQALQALPFEQREVVFLKQLMDLSFREIAETLQISLNTASSRYRYGLEKLRHHLNPSLEEAHVP